MKRIILSTAAFFVMAFSFAQTSSPSPRDPSLGFGFFLKDFVTPVNIHSTSFSSVLSNHNYGKLSDMSLGVDIHYYQGLTSHLDVKGALGGCFTKYGATPNNLATTEQFAVDLNAQLNLKLFTDKVFFNPYLTGGVGISDFNMSNFYESVNTGAGFEFNIGKGTFFYIQTVYDFEINHQILNNLNYSIGYAAPIFKKTKPEKVVVAPPPPPIPEVDTDGDGIPDSKDKCPTVAGVAKYNGCPIPDTDGDGINDEEDKCPTVPGVARYHGCPVPDTDGDGINDEEDSCITVPGIAKYHGCPIPDTDGDGINDEEDKCPTVPGTKENSGCPEIQKKINELAKSVYFNTGTATISSKALQPLDEVIVILKANPTAKLSIEGHTDNTGSEEINKKLSQKRADAIASYLTKKGIDAARLTAKGYGSAKPVVDNNTAAGKAQNRRVELKATY